MIVQLQLGVARVGELGEKGARELGDLRPELDIEVGAHVGVRAIELVVHALVLVQLVELGLRFGEIALGLERGLQRAARCRGFGIGRNGRQLGGTKLGRGTLIFGAQRVEGLLGELHGITLPAKLDDASRRQVRGMRDALALAAEQPVALDLRAEPRGARIEWLQTFNVVP